MSEDYTQEPDDLGCCRGCWNVLPIVIILDACLLVGLIVAWNILVR